MSLKEKFKKLINKVILSEKSPDKLTLSFCVGNFIAFSPTIPLQTPLIFLFSKIFKLNTVVTFTTVYLINNPITLVPIYIIDYIFGNWLFNSVLKIHMNKYNPHWIDKFSAFISKYVNLQPYLGDSVLCFWCLILGGTLLGLILSILIYPIMKIIFTKLLNKYNTKEVKF